MSNPTIGSQDPLARITANTAAGSNEVVFQQSTAIVKNAATSNAVTITTSVNNNTGDVVRVYSTPGAISVSAVDQIINQYTAVNSGVSSIEAGNNISITSTGGNGQGSVTINADISNVGNVAIANNVRLNAQPNITSVGTLTSLSVSGTILGNNVQVSNGVFSGNGSGLTSLPAANITGTVAIAAVVSNGSQPNITSLPNLSNLSLNSFKIALGNLAGAVDQSNSGTAIGEKAGQINQGDFAIAIGQASGNTNQGERSIAIGQIAGFSNQGTAAIAIGFDAGSNNQSQLSVAIGASAGLQAQGANSVAIGAGAGQAGQGINSTFIGAYSGQNSGTPAGANSIMIGAYAGAIQADGNTILLNATGNSFDTNGANRFFVKPIRNANTANVLFYNNTSGEITYDIVGSLQGLQGTTGSIGLQGTTGSIGLQGTTGSIGLQGITGIQGIQGIQSIQGLQGLQGLNGTIVWTTAPISNTSTGIAGQAAYDVGGNFYICVATDTWAKFAGTTSW